ncbi:hypothetical protein GIB67_033697 [Kingdonia uniflora]|uniref:Trafficking protein particle complex subunit 11 domain-containing protein n=1 Tax=Kingdonia uniflora TaxID=39325 RepID=A0A7J7P3Z8_9MAGN|nr:hypothetical protein GIB67_033697 [Kingdonia uniflora]
MFDSNHVSGDPAQWLQVCTDLDNLKVVVRGRNIKLVVVVVQSTVKEEVNEDRMIALRKRAEVDSKYLLVFLQNDSESLNRLTSTLAELANTYYREEGRRIKARIEKKNVNSMELNIRYSFKVAVYAEFRRDWVEALRFYEEAYHTIREMIGASTRLPPVQRLVEIKIIAEQLHFKVSTLLLHRGKIVEAMTWFRKHIACYKRLVGVPEVVFLHWEWVSRQFLVFAELLETSSATGSSTASLTSSMSERGLTEWEFYPAYYYQLAAHYLREKKCCLDLALSESETSGSSIANEFDSSSESVTPSVYVGQFAKLIEQGGTFAMQPLADSEYIRYALVEGKRYQDSFEIIALFKKSFESYRSLQAQRMASYCGNLMAIEYFTIGDFSNAKVIFNRIAGLYRQEGWVTLLWEVLGYLRECSRRLGSVKDFIEYSLQMAALPILSSVTSLFSELKGEYGPAGPPSLPQREIIHEEIFRLVKGEHILSSDEGIHRFEVTEDRPIHLEIDLISPLRLVLLASVVFHDQVVKPGSSTLITLSLLSQLPHPVEIDQLEIQFNQPDCNFVVTGARGSQVNANIDGQQGLRVETAPLLSLVTDKWLRLTYNIKSEQSGKLECISVIAKMGPWFTICCRAESPASMDDLPLWKFEDRVEAFPTKDPALAFSGQKVIQVEEPEPQVDLVVGSTGPALVGENFIIPVFIISKGHAIHSGELKINLLDARGGGLVSPREIEPFSKDNHHVQLLSILGPDGQDEAQNDPDNISKVQEAFGLVSVPFVDIGQSWSCKLEIKWHRPKPAMLFVSLGYMPRGDDSNAQKLQVQRNLQIEGRTAVTIAHKFMLPFRRDPLMLKKIKPTVDSDQLVSLALNETSILVITAKNLSEVPLRLMSMSIEVDDDEIGRSCTVGQGGGDPGLDSLLVPGEEFKKVFSIIPEICSPNLGIGTVCLRWRRESAAEEGSTVVTKHKLPNVNVEIAPLVVSLECPPHAILGDPFTFFVRIKNQTLLLQEIKYSLTDSPSFVLAGPHDDTVFILPKSEHILGYKISALASGPQILPRVTLTSVRYSAGINPSSSASTIFVYPSKPHFKMSEEAVRGPELVATI